jgi:hypothetical protein
VVALVIVVVCPLLVVLDIVVVCAVVVLVTVELIVVVLLLLIVTEVMVLVAVVLVVAVVPVSDVLVQVTVTTFIAGGVMPNEDSTISTPCDLKTACKDPVKLPVSLITACVASTIRLAE